MKGSIPLVVMAAVLLALATLPYYVPYFYIFVATEVLIMGLLAGSYNLIFGYTGMLSFGHAAFFGFGAYITAMLLMHFEVPLLWAMIASMAGALVLAAIIGFFCVRLDEVYFAMLTLAFGMMVFAVALQWRSLTNGSDGISGFPLPEFGLGIDLTLADPMVYYYMVLVIVVLASAVLYLITRSPFGLMLKAISENPERVAFCGVNERRHRLIAFIIAGTFAGLSGALFAPFNRVANPDMVHWTQSAEPVLMTILGGAGYFMGPYFGAAVFVLLETWITSYTDQWMLFLGIVLALMVLFFRRGLLGTVLDRVMGR
ncbi:branched-chain amino acid ABC transporter permease [Ectothiorhodospiraceae bacterium WFHF3C12]|nr:branched-chain amino acid ABC transporter permease [Ectothiorhodospiraceae bacterium WFHF3C12]